MDESGTAESAQEAKPKAGRSRRILKVCIRAVRVTLLTLAILIVGCLIYLSQIGLPPSLQEKLTAKLRQQGWEVQFSKMRLSFSRMGVVAENLYLRRAAGPQIYVARAQCRMRGSALRRMKLELETVKLSGARVIWPLEKTHEPASTFLLNNVRGELHFRENDVWDLQNLTATMMGARVNISGTLTNGSLVRDWRVPQLRAGVREDSLARWRAFLNAAHQVRFEGTPEIVTRFDGNAARLDETRADLMLHVPAVTSPWAGGSNLLISAQLNHDSTADDHPLEVDILFENGNTPWAQATSFRFKTTIGMDFENLVAPTNLAALIEAKSVSGPWGAIEHLAGEVRLNGSPDTPPGLQTTFNLKTGPLRREQFEASAGEIRATAWHNRTNWFVSMLRDLAATNHPLNLRVQQMPAEVDLSLSSAKAGVIRAEELLIRTKWNWPITRVAVEGKIEEGGLRGTAMFNVTNRYAEISATSDVDPHRVSPLLPESARNWLTNYQWQAAPKVQASARIALPEATNKLDWMTDIMPRLFADGTFEIGPSRFRGVPLDSVKSKFWLSNSVVCLPELDLRRGEASARATYVATPATHDFHWQISSRLDPKILRPLFPPPADERAFSLVDFGSLPRISGDVWGRWGDASRLLIVANFEATNLAVRGEPIQVARAGVTFTNLQLDIVEPEIIRPNEQGNASRILVDFRDERIYFTNAHGNLDPYAVSRAIGQSASNAIAPYVFAVPPEITVNGVLDIKSGRREDDMQFVVNGGPFYWQPFHVHRIAGRINWVGYNLLLSDVVAQLHGGQGSGDARFEIATNGQSRFQFRIDWSDIDLRSLVKDLSTKTNSLEGILRGNLQITSAQSSNSKSWNGRGMAEIKDGLIWDFPMFGVFSPILNAFIPRLGNSRARDGAASFIITNSVIHTTDLEINATAMRMRFNGTIDFDRKIDGRMEAELLRNVPGIGLVISKILWPVTKIFEYKIVGTLEQPKTESVYLIPKVILFPLQPIKTIKDLLGIGRESSSPQGGQ
jgi:hypothetical protein